MADMGLQGLGLGSQHPRYRVQRLDIGGGLRFWAILPPNQSLYRPLLNGQRV